MMPQSAESFSEILARTLAEGTLHSLILANPQRRGFDGPSKQTVRPIKLRGERTWQWELQTGKQQSHLNLGAAETLERAETELAAHYREAYLFTSERDYQIRSAKSGLSIKSMVAKQDARPTVTEHDRTKSRLIPEGVPCPFLEALGVMTPAGHVKQQKQKKFRQINRYLEMVNDIVDALPSEGTLHIADFGCGLSYLTFAVHHLLTVVHGRDVRLWGIDQNEQVIRRCQSIAQQLSLQGLEFSTSDIARWRRIGQIDLAISLHACDTATDAALEFAVRSQAKVILAAPCCQHEVSPLLSCEPLVPMLDYGIFQERFAAMATDTLRAIALRACGYKVQVLEFIDLEHTPKNILIRAVRQRDQPATYATRKEYDQWKSFLGLDRISIDGILESGETPRPMDAG
ncbi:MAG: SAM-dependent methyltransferase [Planctomycetaceae bacterium]|nr:SAM-dependent methyltransferase [Planctomycetaceae bacterium]